jgi:peptidyl-prolyl cis-trans isomerase A (cyclophilin A)
VSACEPARRRRLALAASLACACGGTRPPPAATAVVDLPSATSSPEPPSHVQTRPTGVEHLAEPAPSRAVRDGALLDPASATALAPSVFRARFTTTKGDFVVEVHRDWAPHGADRFYNLVRIGFYDDTRFFRAIDGFMVQFGIHGDPRVAAAWKGATIADDPNAHTNARGTISFAKSGAPDSATTQVFVNYGDNSRLDGMRFCPFGEVVTGMDALDALYKGYGEGGPGGQGPSQNRIQAEGNAYLDEGFPRLDRILRARIEGG